VGILPQTGFIAPHSTASASYVLFSVIDREKEERLANGPERILSIPAGHGKGGSWK
jgi:hypothetical protein